MGSSFWGVGSREQGVGSRCHNEKLRFYSLSVLQPAGRNWHSQGLVWKTGLELQVCN